MFARKKVAEPKFGDSSLQFKECGGMGGSASGLGVIHLEIAEVDLRIAVGLVTGFFKDLGPALRLGIEATVLTQPLILALAIDAAIGVGKSIQPGFGDLPATEFATTVDARR